MTIALASIGWAGAVGVLVAYLLLLRRITSADSRLYLSLNFLGSACLAISTSAAHAWPSATVNLIWLAIGFAPLVRALAKFNGWPRRSAQAQRRGVMAGRECTGVPHR